MKRSALIIPILTGAVLAPVAPAVAVAAPAYPGRRRAGARTGQCPHRRAA